LPAFRNGGAKGGRFSRPFIIAIILSMPPDLRATSSYEASASSSASRTNSPRPWMPGQ